MAVDLFDARAGTPTLVLLQQYDIVAPFSKFAFADATTLGDNLANYVDGGGIVVQLGVSFTGPDRPYGVNGRWFSGGYSPYAYSNLDLSGAFNLGAFTAAHPLMQGVTALQSINSDHNKVTLAAGATEVAAWDNGDSLIATQSVGLRTTVGVTAYLGANGIWSGDFARVIANAGRWLHPPVCPSPTPTATATPTCVPGTFIFEGNSATTGTAGNIRTFTLSGLTVNVSGFNRVDSSGAWSTAYLGLYGEGLGVTNFSEGTGSNNQHTVDNIGGNRDYVEFEFSAPIVVTRAFLDYVYTGDSDMSVWIGTKPAGHNTLSDAFLASLGPQENNNTNLTTSRWAVFNAANTVGNVVVISASTISTNDAFKIHKLLFGCQTGTPTPPPCATFANPAAIDILDNQVAAPYPSTINVTGTNGTVVYVTVKLKNFSHTWGNDVDVLLVGPGGQTLRLMENAGTGTTNNSTLTFSDNTPNRLPKTGALRTGTYKPTAYVPATTYPAPAPGGTYGTTLSVFNGTVANGAWSLYVIDDGPIDVGSFAGGWELSILTTDCVGPTPTPVPTPVATPTPTPSCVPKTFVFEGNTAASGAAGNIRTYTVSGVTVNVSGWNRVDGNTDTWSPSYLGVYSHGLGVTNFSEGSGDNDQHVVDNIGGNRDYVLFEFSSPIVVDQAYLDYVIGDSDISVWIGTAPAGHNTLSDAFLASLGPEEDNDTTLTTPRWANINAGAVSGNVLVISASASDTAPNDGFKIRKLLLGDCQGGPGATPTPGCPTITLSPTTTSLPYGKVNQSYSKTITASGGSSPYTFMTTSGSLPNGITLSSGGVLSGMPTVAATFSFTIQAKDTYFCTGSKAYTLNIRN